MQIVIGYESSSKRQARHIASIFIPEQKNKHDKVRGYN
jgi:hypothetical protein